LRQTSGHEPRSSCDGNQFEEIRNPAFDIVESRADNKFGEFILPLTISYLNIIQATGQSPFSQECQGSEEHTYAHTVANCKYPSNPNYAEHIG
jgi:hypothetical protein